MSPRRSPPLSGPVLVLSAALVVGACGGDDAVLPEAATLEVVAPSNEQSAPAGGSLPAPLQVVIRAADGTVVGGARVQWTVTDGNGASLSDSVTLSDGTGRAQVTLRLGPTPGNYRVRARLASVAEQATIFSATATPPPAITAVQPGTFGGGDTLVLTGTALAGVTRVEVASGTARIVSVAETAVSVLAPHCLVAGPVQIRAFVRDAPSNTRTGTFDDPADTLSLAVGDYILLDPSQVAGCAVFPAAGPGGAEYLVTAQSVSPTPGLQQDFVLGGDSAVDTAMTSAPRSRTRAMQFHDFLRAQEGLASAGPRPAAPPATGGMSAVRAAPTVAVGDRREFRVCNIITCQQLTDFTQVTAEARFVGRRAAIFVDVAAPAQGFSPADLDSLGTLFDEDLYEVNTRAFGAESDVDSNGVVAILFTPVVNGLTPSEQCQTSIITGFFFGIDIDPIFQNDPRSNKGEVFYALTPDPTGEVTCSLDAGLVRRLIQVTFVHEFQHMISYNQHVLQRNGDVEVLWLNEGLSHIAEELAALRFEARGDNDRFSRFAIGNLFNGYLFLEEPGDHFTLPEEGTGSLEERGSAWLFLRWIVDQFGEEILRPLVETRQRGAENLAAVVGEPFDRLLSEWFLSLWVSDLPGFTAPARLRYGTWSFRTTYESLHDQLPARFTQAFPIVPVEFVGGEGLATGTMRSGSGEFFRMIQQADDPGFALRFTAPGGGALPGAAAPRLNILRVR